MKNYGQVLRYAVITGRANSDMSLNLRGALQPVKSRNYASTDPTAIPHLLRAIEGYKGHFATQCTLKLTPLFLYVQVNLDKRNDQNSILKSMNGVFLHVK